MIPVSIDMSDVVKAFELSDEMVDGLKSTVVSELTEIIHESWKRQAFNELNSTRSSYINGLIVVEEGMFSNSIVLTGRFNNMIEFGASAFDMKEGFSKSDKVKFNKNGGWYLTIPYRWTKSGSGEDGMVMPKDIAQIVQDLGIVTTENLPSQYEPQTRRKIVTEEQKVFEKYKHKTSIYLGIQRQDAVYENSVQSTAVSFRRVGEMSDPNSWVHPGITAHNLAEKAVESVDIDAISNGIINRELINLGF